MIPLKLELKNFLSYGENVERIDFKDYSLICFSGKNGNGKSAILDAITWVIWGQARKISGTVKPDAGLLHLGQTRMFVSIEFEFAQNCYRIRREFAKTYGKPCFFLDFELFDQVAQKFIPLTDKTVRQTQLKIENLLGLDYETFVNSAFLRQGAADEFSKKTPKERKQILANILGVSKFDELQNLALEQTRIFVEEKKLNEKMQEQSDEQIKKEAEIIKNLDAQSVVLEKINFELEQLEIKMVSFRKEKDILEQQKQKYSFLLEEQQKWQQKFNFKLRDFKEVILAWKKVHYQSLRLPDFQMLEKEKNDLIRCEKTFLELQKKSLFLQEQILQKKDFHQKEIRTYMEKKEKELYEKRFLIEKYEFELKQLLILAEQKEKFKSELDLKIKGHKQEVKGIQGNVKKREFFEKEAEKIKAQFEKRKIFYQTLVQKGNWITAELKDLEQKIKVIKDQTSPCCPLCEQVLSVKRKVFLNSKFQKDLQFLNYRLCRVTSLIKKMKNILLLQHEQLKSCEQNDVFYRQLFAKKEELEKVLIKDEQEYDDVCKLLGGLKMEEGVFHKKIESARRELKKQEETVEEELKNDEKFKQLSAELKVLEKEKNDLNYDKKSHLELQGRLNKIEGKLQELDLVRQELLDQKERKNRIKLWIVELKELKQLLVQAELEIKELKLDLKIVQELENKVEVLRKQINERSLEKEKILQKIGSIKSEIKRICELKEEKEKQRVRQIFLDEQIEEYKILAQALGKDGIQALLIEQAIPQIEEEANTILSRLTDNQAQIFIESLRDLKSGGVRETLDIQISDSAGIRPYEMFSGGEAFRVDFALRIAISKLLARRAGTALQTLIIDEGFGSQDEEGLSRLMDSIYAIQKDFSKIIIVSHLTSLKDNFPIHFIVEKNALGSFVRIEERG